MRRWSREFNRVYCVFTLPRGASRPKKCESKWLHMRVKYKKKYPSSFRHFRPSPSLPRRAQCTNRSLSSPHPSAEHCHCCSPIHPPTRFPISDRAAPHTPPAQPNPEPQPVDSKPAAVAAWAPVDELVRVRQPACVTLCQNRRSQQYQGLNSPVSEELASAIVSVILLAPPLHGLKL